MAASVRRCLRRLLNAFSIGEPKARFQAERSVILRRPRIVKSKFVSKTVIVRV